MLSFVIARLKSLLTHGATLLGLSALASKGLSLLRDRLVLDQFSDPAVVDAIYASFRIPDFLFFLFIASTISVIFIPRVEQTDQEDRADYVASFFWWVVLVFGVVCGFGIVSLPYLVPWLFGGLDPGAQSIVIELSRWLFLTSFLLAIQALFSAYLQWREIFWPVALAPLLYMGGVIAGLAFLVPAFSVQAIAIGAGGGVFLSLILSQYLLRREGLIFGFRWQKPVESWQGFAGDFFRRLLAGSSFQINQTIDVIIASCLVVGSIAAFSIGTAVGHFLLSVVGYSVSNALFPRLTKLKDPAAQWAIMRKGIVMILLMTIPASVVGILISDWALALVFGLEGERLWMTSVVFQFTVASLPCACLIPLFSRSFLARNDTQTPLFISYTSLTVATALAAYLSLIHFSGTASIIGLGIGNFVANVGSLILFVGAYRKILNSKFKVQNKS